MASVIRGTDIPFDLKNFPVGAEIKRLDFAQNDKIVLTKYAEDFTFDGEVYNATITQEEALKFDSKKLVEVQLSFALNGHIHKTHVKSFRADKTLYEGVI